MSMSVVILSMDHTPLAAGIRHVSATPRRAHRHLKPPNTLRYPRRTEFPPPLNRESGDAKLPNEDKRNDAISTVRDTGDARLSNEANGDADADAGSVWSSEELEAISALFERPTPAPKPRNQLRPRPLPLPIPYQNRPLRVPTPKRHIPPEFRSRSTFTDRVSRNPEALVGIAREIRDLPPDADASDVLDGLSPFIRKGSLSMTIRELGHMGLPERALQTLCWAQRRRPELFPDDRILASAVEVLARSGQLKLEERELVDYLNSASRTVVEAMATGFIRAGNLRRARKILLLTRDSKRTLGSSVHAKLILEAVKTPDGYRLAAALLDELGEKETLDLTPTDCNSVMKACVKLGRFDAVERLFDWFKGTGRDPSVVMYTTVVHSRHRGKKYREAMALVWEMEGLDCLLDLPAYRVVIKLCVAVDDLARAARYYSRLKEAGFSPTYDVYRDMIQAYANSGRLAKCRKIRKEMEAAGLKMDKENYV